MKTNTPLTDLSRIPHTGQKHAIFFNAMYASNLQQAIAKYIPGEMTITKNRVRMQEIIRQAGLTVAIPEKVCRSWEQHPGSDSPKTPRVAMVITDRNPDMVREAIQAIADDTEYEFREMEERSRIEDPLFETAEDA